MFNKRLKKRWIALFVILFFSFAFIRAYLKVTDDFRLSHITYPMPYHSEWEIPPLSIEENSLLNTIFSQEFNYIGKGAQSYVFGSADQKYVLKLFKFKHLKPSFLISFFPSSTFLSNMQQKNQKRKERKVLEIFTGYKLAYDLHKEETGPFFIQLNPSHVSKKVRLKDKVGLTREIDLGEVVYVVQEKGRTLRSDLTQLLNQGNTEKAKDHIRKIFNLYLSEYKKGIFDQDHGVLENMGFIGERPTHLDVGKMIRKESMREPFHYHPDLAKVAEKIRRWISLNYAKYYQELTEDLKKYLTEVMNEEFRFIEL